MKNKHQPEIRLSGYLGFFLVPLTTINPWFFQNIIEILEIQDSRIAKHPAACSPCSRAAAWQMSDGSGRL